MLVANIEAQLDYFDLKVEIAVDKEILVLLGPSGCGKTTALKCIAGLTVPKSGFVRLNGRTLFSSIDMINIPTRLRKIGFVFQDYALFPHMTVEQNVRYGLTVNRKASGNKALTSQMLDMMKITHLKNRFPRHLSGGEKQRVALARALINKPELLLLDEPLSALDADTRLELQTELKVIQSRWNIPCILVTHDSEEAERMGSNKAHLELSDRERKFVHAGSDSSRIWW